MKTGQIRVLAVDDESSFTSLLKEYLSPRGYDIDVASCGEQALQMTEPGKYSVALLDLKMVGMNGDQVMRRLKSIDDRIEVIFVSAYDDAGRTRSKLLEEGAFAFLDKPVASLKKLENVVSEAAERTKGKGGKC